MEESVEEFISKIANENSCQVPNYLTNLHDNSCKDNEVNNAPPASTITGVCNENRSNVCEVGNGADKVIPLATPEYNLQADYCSESNALAAYPINETAAEVRTQEIIPVSQISNEINNENNASSLSTIETINQTLPEVHAMDAIVGSNAPVNVDNNQVIGIDVSGLTNGGTIVAVFSEPVLVSLGNETTVSNAVIAVPLSEVHVDGLQNLQIDYVNGNNMRVVPAANHTDCVNENNMMVVPIVGNPNYVNENAMMVVPTATAGNPDYVNENNMIVVPTATGGNSDYVNENNMMVVPATSTPDYVYENSMMAVLTAGNTDISELNENEEELLRGDAIGDTMYSSRFILSVVFELTKDITEEIADSELEDNLCTLWDMSVDSEVIKYMLQFDVLDIFFICLEKTNDKRLTELLIGIMGNMCNSIETIQAMYSKHKGLVHYLLELCSCTDVRILEQLMRLWTVLLFKSGSNEEVIQWHQLICNNNDFINNIIHILTNAFRKGLLLTTMETLYILVLRYSAMLESLADEGASNTAMLLSEFKDRFIRSDIVMATAEALQTYLVNIEYASDSFEEDGSFEVNNNERKFKQVFCSLHSLLTRYSPNTEAAYEGNYQEVGKCMQLILEGIYEESCESGFKAWDEYEIDILQSVTDFITIAPFNEAIVVICAKIWYNIVTDIEIEKSQPKNANTDYFDKLLEGESDFYEESAVELSKKLFSFLAYCIRKADDDALKKCFNCIDSKINAKFIKTLESIEKKNIIARYCLDRLCA